MGEVDWPSDEDSESLIFAFRQAAFCSQIVAPVDLPPLPADRLSHAIRLMGWSTLGRNLQGLEATLADGITFPRFVELMRPRIGVAKAPWMLETGSFVLRALAKHDAA